MPRHMTNPSLKEIVEVLRRPGSFLVTTHENPDGDAIGSMLALTHLLRAMGHKEVTAACNDPVPQIYSWLSGAEDVVTADWANLDPVDRVIVIDVGQLDRIGGVAKAFGPEQEIMVLDHHLEDAPCGAINFVDATYAAASEIVVELYEHAGLEMSLEAAECAYVALITDTGGFRFGNTSARSHLTAAKLIEAGVNPAAIAGRVFDVLSLPKLELLRRVLDRMEIDPSGRFAHSFLTGEDMSQAQAKGEDLDGLVNFGRNIEGVEVGVLFRRIEEKKVKVSLRSMGGFNSADLLKAYGGGGHKGAAGATLDMTLEQAQSAILGRVRESLEATPAKANRN